MVERFNGSIKDVLQSRRFRSGEDSGATILHDVRLYNGQLPQSDLKGRTPVDALKDWHRQKRGSSSRTTRTITPEVISSPRHRAIAATCAGHVAVEVAEDDCRATIQADEGTSIYAHGEPELTRVKTAVFARSSTLTPRSTERC